VIAARSMLAILLAIALTACASGPRSPLPAGQEAYAVIPVTAHGGAEQQLIRPGDRLSVRVFGEPELTSEQYRVDAAGYLQIPLVGEIIAAGQSPDELRREVTRRLAARYVRDPQVSVAVVESASSKVAVEGEVEQPGIYDIGTTSTLLTALAQAQSPTNTAKLDEIIVFRMVDGQRMGARFDLRDIRTGRAPDPQILAGDTIVVGFSSVKGAFRDFLQAAPLLSLFVRY
jgi:polysaccharide export outer membrane protein